MTVKEMFNELEDKERDTIIVTLKYKYDFEENYTIENHILEYDFMSDSYVWLNDWNEGQTDVEVLGYMPLGNVDTTKIEPCDDCISRESVIEWLKDKDIIKMNYQEENARRELASLPSVTPSYNSIKTELKPSEDWKFYYNHGYAQAKRDLLCDDCISREAVMKCFKKWQPYMATRLLDYEQELKELPSVTPKTEWIPVSEKMPPIAQRVLVSATNGEVFIARYHSFDKWTFEPTGISYAYNKDSIVAWMPLPESYKVESNIEQVLAYADQDTLMPAT
jgi:hypothetical protein